MFETVHALSKEGLSCSEIARRTGYGRRSIAKWLTFAAPPDRRRAALQPTSPRYFEAFLIQCWKDGNCCGRHLFHDIKHRGYTGSFSNLERLLATWRRAAKPGKDKDNAVPAPIVLADQADDNAPVRDPQTGHLISPVIAAALCIKPRGALTSIRRGKSMPSSRDQMRLLFCATSPCDFAVYFVAELRRNSKNGSMMPFTPGSLPWPVLPAFFAVISTPSVTPSICPGQWSGRRSDQPTEDD
ncbi:hypothetical protein GGD56_006963 [Rhizobium mongolense]|uniref:Transposase n=1 Tax=Rhizobium mongolense TaxID=57676 RepID=A0ABR6IZH7_9HYPH|nr:hypothetical protein [Rhizobium mongolense]